jgi:hypothetical protein
MSQSGGFVSIINFFAASTRTRSTTLSEYVALTAVIPAYDRTLTDTTKPCSVARTAPDAQHPVALGTIDVAARSMLTARCLENKRLATDRRTQPR